MREDDQRRRREQGEGDLDEVLDRERLGSGEHEQDERYGREDVSPNRGRKEAGDEGRKEVEEGSEEALEREEELRE